MNRLPSRRTLESMAAETRHATLHAFARDLREELDAFDAGIARAVDGVPISQYRRNAKRRLKRVYSLADCFGDHVGQHG